MYLVILVPINGLNIVHFFFGFISSLFSFVLFLAFSASFVLYQDFFSFGFISRLFLFWFFFLAFFVFCFISFSLSSRQILFLCLTRSSLSNIYLMQLLSINRTIVVKLSPLSISPPTRSFSLAPLLLSLHASATRLCFRRRC